jgi:hypothetical protein
MKTGMAKTNSNIEYPTEEEIQRLIDEQSARVIRSAPTSPQDRDRSLEGLSANTLGSYTPLPATPTPQLVSASKQSFPVPTSPSTGGALQVGSSYSFKIGQAANSTTATLDPIWTKTSIVGVAGTAAATVVINGVNANTNRTMADISERSATIAERAADASEQNAIAALSAADTAAKKLMFDQEESMKKKAKEEGLSNGAVINNNAIAGSSKTVAPSKVVLNPIAVPPTKPSSTQMQFEAQIRKRYEERELKKHVEKQKMASNIRAFKNRLKHPFKGVSSAKEEELDRKLREQRSNHDQHEHGAEARDTEVDNPRSRRKRKGKEKDMGSVVSGSSTSADMADGDGVESEVISGQEPQPWLSASTFDVGKGEINCDSAKEPVTR